MKLEGTELEPDVPQGTLAVTVKNTNARELVRLYETINTLFNQGIMNMRNGKAVLHFDDSGKLRGVDKEVSSWRDGKEVVTRVAMYETAVVEILGK